MLKLVKAIAVICVCGVLGGCGSNMTDIAYTPKKVSYVAKTYNSPAGLDIPSEYAKMAESPRMLLFADQNTGRFILVDKSDGRVWNSNPEWVEYDESIASADMLSQLIVEYSNFTDRLNYANSYTSAVMYADAGGLKVEKTDNGFRAVYTFMHEGFRIPVEYSIENDYFEAKIATADIRRNKNVCVTQITLLPFFAAGSENDNGYIYVPDGCGGIIRFNNQKGRHGYDQAIYGNDTGRNRKWDYFKSQQAVLPFFGILSNGKGLLAAIHSGAEQARVRAGVPGGDYSANWVNATFTYHESAPVDIVSREDSSADEIVTFASAPVKQPYFTLRYYPVRDDSYISLAERAREYLTAEQGMESKPAKTNILHFNIYGAFRRLKNSIMGIPYIGIDTATTFSQAEEILNGFSDQDAKLLSVLYLGWNNGGIEPFTMQTGYHPEKSLGGKDGLNKLRKLSERRGIQFYFNFEPLVFYKSGEGYSTLTSAAKDIIGMSAKIYKYDVVNRERIKDSVHYYTGGGSFARAIDQIAYTLKKQKIKKIGISSVGSMLFAQRERDDFSRYATMTRYQLGLQKLKESGAAILTDGANAYTYPFAEFITNVPVSTSGYKILDEEIPFVQMVLKGYIGLSAAPANLADNPETVFLKSIQSGMSLNYSFSYEDATIFRDTDFVNLYGASYRSWNFKYKEQFLKAKDFLASVNGEYITGFSAPDAGVTVTEFSNGIKVYVNFSDIEKTIDGIRVEAKGFAVI